MEGTKSLTDSICPNIKRKNILKNLKMSKLSMLSCLFVLIMIGQSVAQPSDSTRWKLDWEDDFSFLDESRWSVLNYAAHGKELQLYMADNVWAEDGNLVIRLNNRPVECLPEKNWVAVNSCELCKQGVYPYSSGWVETKKSYYRKYGYIEARIKCPYRRGLWPAFWTFIGMGIPDASNYAEIDIFELYGHKRPNHVETNIHLVYEPGTFTKNLQEHNLKKFSYVNWHTYAIEWDSTKIVWYIDNQPIRTTYNHGVVDPVRIIFNMAVQTKRRLQPRKKSYFEEKMYVDYIRVYKL